MMGPLSLSLLVPLFLSASVSALPHDVQPAAITSSPQAVWNVVSESPILRTLDSKIEKRAIVARNDTSVKVKKLEEILLRGRKEIGKAVLFRDSHHSRAGIAQFGGCNLNPSGCSELSETFIRETILEILDGHVYAELSSEKPQTNTGDKGDTTLTLTESVATAKQATIGWNVNVQLSSKVGKGGADVSFGYTNTKSTSVTFTESRADSGSCPPRSHRAWQTYVFRARIKAKCSKDAMVKCDSQPRSMCADRARWIEGCVHQRQKTIEGCALAHGLETVEREIDFPIFDPKGKPISHLVWVVEPMDKTSEKQE